MDTAGTKTLSEKLSHKNSFLRYGRTCAIFVSRGHMARPAFLSNEVSVLKEALRCIGNLTTDDANILVVVRQQATGDLNLQNIVLYSWGLLIGLVYLAICNVVIPIWVFF